MAQRKGATPAQVALAWLLAKKSGIMPIPGTTKLERLEENPGAVAVEFGSDGLREICAAASKMKLKGAGLPVDALKMACVWPTVMARN